MSGPEKKNVKKEALSLSLKYGFVTPLTSMVVTKPLGENTDVLDKPKEGETPQATPSLHGRTMQYPGMMIPSRDFALRSEQHKCEQNKHNAKSVMVNFTFSTFLS